MPPVAPEPILDVVRGLSTLASFAIVVNQLKNIYDSFFVSECERCRGTGIVTCPHCHGTKTLRQRPGYLRTRDFGIVDDSRDSYLCFYCGPSTKFDTNPFAEDDEQRAMEIQENLKFAVANIFPRPFDAVPTAGTVSCPSCLGSPKVHRITPDFAKALDMGPLWDEKVAARMGSWFWGKESRPADKRRIYLEYPSARVARTVEEPVPRPRELTASEKDALEQEKKQKEREARSGFRVEQTFNLEDFILPWASDDED